MDVPAIISDKLQQSFVEFVEVPQLQFIDIVVGFVVRRDRAHSANCAEDGAVLGLGHARRCATTGPDGPDSSDWRCRRSSSCQVVDVLAVMQDVPEFPVKPGGASDSVHRKSWVMAAVQGFSAHFAPFFSRSSGCPGVERQSQLGSPR